MVRRVALASLLAVAACSGAPPAERAAVHEAPKPVAYTREAPLPGATRAVFTIPRQGQTPSFFDLPWPSELRRRDGRPDFAGFPGEGAPIAGEYVATAARDVDGFSIAPVVYVRFDGAMAASRLPRPEATRAPSSPVLLVDVDPASPERGALYPLEFRLFGAGNRFVPANTLAIKPVAGFVLRPGTLYAAVVRRALGDAAGRPLGTTRDLELVKNTRPRTDADEEAARRLHAGAFDALAAMGVAREDVAAIALFRTQRPAAITERLLDVAARLSGDAAPRIVDAAWDEHAPHRGRVAPTSYTVVRGHYCTPNFQGEIERAPFLDGGGELVLDEAGAPRVVPLPAASPYRTDACGGRIRARFVLSIPNRPMPPSGYPLMLSAHGTGGNALTFLGEDDFAGWAAREGIAVVSTDQPVHGGDDPAGARPGSREPVVLRVAGFPLPLGAGQALTELGFYNPLHPGAARDNLRQATVDGYVLLHLVASTDFAKLARPGGAPLLAAGPRPAPRFDAQRLFYAGHSQGSQSVAVLGALDPSARAVVLSGCGGDARVGIVKRRDLAITTLVSALLGVGPDELDEFHPLLALVQTLADPIDPESYGRFYWEKPGARAPARVIHFEGVTDSFNPPEAAEALAVALRATPIGRLVHAVRGLDLLGAARNEGALFAQFRSTRGEDGHFVLYYEPAASDELRRFLRGALAGG
ncbi:MAG TPA: hypothetical protein VHB21_05415 [Minicystis sp.]|nr:hypothetical protein [Minicystis sp.]